MNKYITIAKHELYYFGQLIPQLPNNANLACVSHKHHIHSSPHLCSPYPLTQNALLIPSILQLSLSSGSPPCMG